ncbi:MAG: glycosyltransferase family 4 protein [Desulfuromusa sp.]|nr:glycosyltransferase family 4 protein [Desulfuromusa sp.]
MKVLNVNHLLDPVTGGGTAERTFQMSRFLAEAGVDCSILTTDVGLSSERIKALNGVEVLALPCLLKRFYIPRFSYRKIRKLVESVDIIHLMGHWTFLNALVFFIAGRLGKPYVVCPAGALPIFGRSMVFKTIYNLAVGRRIMANADGYIAITEDEIPQFQAYGVDSDKVVIIPNGIDRAEYTVISDDEFRKKYRLNSDPIILFVGRLNPIKGPDLLLQAFLLLKVRLHEFHLVFVGPDGGMLAELKEMVAASDAAERVHFIGYLGGIDKIQAYHAAELLVVPSRQEAMSIVALEAGITATPVLLTDQCGFEGVATVGGGKVVPATVEGLQQGLRELLRDCGRLKLMGVNLKRHVSEHFTWDSVINNFLKLYQQLT